MSLHKSISITIDLQARASDCYEPSKFQDAQFRLDIPVIDGKPFIPGLDWTLPEIIKEMVDTVVMNDPEMVPSALTGGKTLKELNHDL